MKTKVALVVSDLDGFEQIVKIKKFKEVKMVELIELDGKKKSYNARLLYKNKIYDVTGLNREHYLKLKFSKFEIKGFVTRNNFYLILN